MKRVVLPLLALALVAGACGGKEDKNKIDQNVGPVSTSSTSALGVNTSTTLALAAGSRVIAVVLSGHGHDGATGATAVHRMGGTVLASDQASSRAFSMPSATIERDNATDHIVHLDDIGEMLNRLVSA